MNLSMQSSAWSPGGSLCDSVFGSGVFLGGGEGAEETPHTAEGPNVKKRSLMSEVSLLWLWISGRPSALDWGLSSSLCRSKLEGSLSKDWNQLVTECVFRKIII